MRAAYHTLADMDASVWLLALAVGVLVYLVVRSRRRARRDPERYERLRTVREQEALNLARHMWMGGGG